MSFMKDLLKKLKAKTWTHEEITVLAECIASNQALLKIKQKDCGAPITGPSEKEMAKL